ncbi:MAG: YbcC family protein [Gammaproteobacteria bacterium]
MTISAPRSPFTPSPDNPLSAAAFDLDAVLEHILHWLPIQGPIKDFVHHNTLHAFQNRPFHEGVAAAARIYGARSYLPLADYQQRYRQGRIGDQAIAWAIDQAAAEIRNPQKFRESLFIEDERSHYPPVSLANQGIRSHWQTALEIDLNALVHPVLFRLLGNFLDQGISRWSLPRKDERFWDCVWRLAHNSLLPLHPFHETAARALLLQSPEQVILACLEKMVGDESLYAQYLLEMQLAHPGWSGMVRLVEHNPQSLLARRSISLKEVIAVELAAELAFLQLKKGRDFQAVAATSKASTIPRLADHDVKPKVPLRLKVWHEALEWSLHVELLKALSAQPSKTDAPTPLKPEVQALFCLDDRECSLRRHLEHEHPDIETFGAAGFFGIDFLYQGLDDAYPVAQCPAIVTPRHLIRESSLSAEPLSKKKDKAALKRLHVRPFSLFRGWLFTQTIGIGYALRLAWNVFRPGGQLPKIRKLSEVKAHTRLHLLRESDLPTEDGRILGFSFSEMADRIEGLLRNIGLTRHFAPLIVVVAHGSSSVNNPHFAAYDCGACSGKPGAPNARAFAWMANHATVRALLRERDIDIPESTLFIAALHNTSRDEISYFDEPEETLIQNRLQTFKPFMRNALELNALERCRWFELGPAHPTAKAAHEHVKARSQSIYEPRPEYNHSNNLYCIVGRRELTRDLYLDRRAFLHSYDPDTDPQGSILARILTAVIPVCGGINLEYLFSRIDNSVYGAGTKLPHNVIGLLGVANGVEGDLRTGLPSQMIEVHEPARLLIAVEQSREIVDKALAKIGEVREWIDNEWVRLASCDPESRLIHFYAQGDWQTVDLAHEPSTPVAISSEAIFTGQCATLPPQILARRST